MMSAIKRGKIVIMKRVEHYMCRCIVVLAALFLLCLSIIPSGHVAHAKPLSTLTILADGDDGKNDSASDDADAENKLNPNPSMGKGDRAEIRKADHGSKDTKCRDGTSTFGWIICPGLDGVTRAIDGVVSMIANMLKWTILAQNLSGENSQTTILKVWQNVLSIANIAIAAAFMIMLYSYALNSNNTFKAYTVKTLLSRLIVVAVATNFSFYICAALADLSNIAGVGVYELIINEIRNDGADGQYNGLLDSINVILKGIGLIVLAFLNAGVVILAVLTIFGAIALRQIALVVLVIMSPLAFACYLLPNTEKWFRKWWDSYIRLLIVFPFFTAAWAGCRMVGYIIAEMPGLDTASAGIISTLTTIAPPLLILPIFKMSSGLMGKMTNMSRGAIDKTGMSARLQNRDKRTKKRAGNAVKRGTMKVQNKLANANTKSGFLNTLAHGAAFGVGIANGTRAEAAAKRSDEATKKAAKETTDNINKNREKNKINHADRKLDKKNAGEINQIATTGMDANGNQVDEYTQAAAIQRADKNNTLSKNDYAKVLSAAQQSKSSAVINAAADSRFGKEWLMDQESQDNFKNQKGEWSNIKSDDDTQAAINKSLSRVTASANTWSDLSIEQRTRVADRALKTGDVNLVNNVERVNQAAYENRKILQSTDDDIAQYQHQLQSINDAKKGNTYDITDSGRF